MDINTSCNHLRELLSLNHIAAFPDKICIYTS